MKAVIMLSDEDRKNIKELFDQIDEQKKRLESARSKAYADGNIEAVTRLGVWIASQDVVISKVLSALEAVGIDTFSVFENDETGIERQD